MISNVGLPEKFDSVSLGVLGNVNAEWIHQIPVSQSTIFDRMKDYKLE